MGDNSINQQLKSQVEYYFSPANLVRDNYLRNQLMPTPNGGWIISTNVIANFPKVKALTGDMALIVKSLEGSEIVKPSKDGQWLTPAFVPPPSSPSSSLPPPPTVSPTPPPPSAGGAASTSGGLSAALSGEAGSGNASDTSPSQPQRTRNTVILRDVPTSTTVETIMSTFTTDNVTPKSARPDVGNTWYVTFSTESDAVDAVLKCGSKTIDGAPVRARVKSEATAPTNQSYNPAGYQGGGTNMNQGTGQQGGVGQGQMPGQYGQGPYGQPVGQAGGIPMSGGRGPIPMHAGQGFVPPTIMMGNPYGQGMQMGYSPSNGMYMTSGAG
eukprot:CAMPEP_0118642340 /NCGR_PEP_ID=MMETSP0785-20121206/5783_1 /TAXON_ID=91992 /ORGANISM="Bolidomonas pacifica, Strain CCMP 1866" /LENGTH=325 /DNA_ID=CAMNT_0006533885 /DNA_START=201 /DNA_END=1175 /DNA_ORIENTATION=+